MSSVVILLGENDEYLGYKTFDYSFKAELFIEKLHPLMIANIEKKLNLKERLQLAPEYFPFAGRVQDVELITLTTEKGEKNE
jgi:hypothetical protein